MMGWKEETAMSNKEKFITKALEKKMPFATLCKDFEISRECGYKWLKRYQEQGAHGLHEKSRKPNSSPFKTHSDIESMIIDVRDKHPAWGGRKIHAYLKQRGNDILPAPSTITRILQRHNKIQEDESIKHKAFIRFEHELPNQLWQMDFKGYFGIGAERCYPLTILDDHSRYSLGIEACKNEQIWTVKKELIHIFRKYGLPERMTMDNGSPWGFSRADKGYTLLEVWLIQLGIKVSHSRPFHPQTQGKDERFHRSLKEEFLARKEFENFTEAQEAFNEWKQCYNYERPHEACGMYPPASRYRPSERKYPEILPSIEYEEGSEVRKVSNKGYIQVKGRYYYMSESMGGLFVKVVESSREGILEVYLNHQKMKEIDYINDKVAKRIS